MLVLSRKVGEQLVLPSCSVTVSVLGVRGKKVRLGISAPPNVGVHRRETWERICAAEESPVAVVEACPHAEQRRGESMEYSEDQIR